MANPRESCVSNATVKAYFVLGIACLLTISGHVEGSLFRARRLLAEETVFNIMDYGAKADGQSDDATVREYSLRCTHIDKYNNSLFFIAKTDITSKCSKVTLNWKKKKFCFEIIKWHLIGKKNEKQNDI